MPKHSGRGFVKPQFHPPPPLAAEERTPPPRREAPPPPTTTTTTPSSLNTSPVVAVTAALTSVSSPSPRRDELDSVEVSPYDFIRLPTSDTCMGSEKKYRTSHPCKSELEWCRELLKKERELEER
ncbi:uncharacterized protein TM35_000052810 [Trypanosoma theileri]|uniref:Uncharacterized protein n=1 Tax=Trypanosoma theileri TaxID=67003 RepID=A0A1X0P486_9TRYP|nr:uncharacterized protein TM35_000052810 [Trypanosoma theileri]ORC91685.1 hypothetical protein TM35_000052810 [Trypanosoma theileri]